MSEGQTHREHGDALDALRETWSSYVGDWQRDPALSLGGTTLGDEWGGPGFADELVDTFAAPYLGTQKDVLELGCGGGKFSQRLAPRCRSLICTDISPQMIAQTEATLTGLGLGANVRYQVLGGADFEAVASNSIDFIFSYDVLLHVQPQNVFSYLLDARRVLRAGGTLMLHQVDLASPGGMDHFIGQYLHGTWRHDLAHPHRRGHVFFMSEDQLHAIAEAASLAVEHLSVGRSAPAGVLRDVTGGRDLIAFLTPGNRLRERSLDELDLLRVDGEDTVHVAWEGQRAAIQSAHHFADAGFDWQRVRVVDAQELAGLTELRALEPWEWPRAT